MGICWHRDLPQKHQENEDTLRTDRETQEANANREADNLGGRDVWANTVRGLARRHLPHQEARHRDHAPRQMLTVLPNRGMHQMAHREEHRAQRWRT